MARNAADRLCNARQSHLVSVSRETSHMSHMLERMKGGWRSQLFRGSRNEAVRGAPPSSPLAARAAGFCRSRRNRGDLAPMTGNGHPAPLRPHHPPRGAPRRSRAARARTRRRNRPLVGLMWRARPMGQRGDRALVESPLQRSQWGSRARVRDPPSVEGAALQRSRPGPMPRTRRAARRTTGPARPCGGAIPAQGRPRIVVRGYATHPRDGPHAAPHVDAR